MEVRALDSRRPKEALLAFVCIAAVFCNISCGGGGSAPVVATPAPGFSLSSTSIDFSKQGVGTTSAPQSATLTNVGNASLALSSIEVSGPDAADFALTNNCGSSLAPSGQCTLTVTFRPGSSGTRSASIMLADNAAGSPQTVSLSGTGVAPAVSLSATSLSFGTQPVATCSAAETVTLTNTGSAALSMGHLEVMGVNPGDFVEMENTCGGSVAAGSACTIGVTFTPTAGGKRTATLSITDNDPGSPQTVSLSGTGIAPAVSLSTTNLSFGSQGIAITSGAETVTLNNTGSAALSITSLSVLGANSSDFVEMANTCGGSLAVGSACTIGVTFTPSASGARAATLSIADNDPGSPQTVSLTGAGIHDVVLAWTASETGGNVTYNVYRGSASGGESSTPLNATPISGTTYVDESVASGATYYYVVKTVASNGAQSAPSGETEATVPAD